MPITNEKIKNYQFLNDMYRDNYYPNHVVDMGKAILVRLCERIEEEKPATLEALYALTHAATEESNDLQDMFFENESEIESMARDCIGDNYYEIATAYGFEADPEELIAPRDW